MIDLLLQCLIAGHTEIGPSLYEIDLLCVDSSVVTYVVQQIPEGHHGAVTSREY